MRLSDEIVLGSSLITLNPATWLRKDCGCFIGMAAKSRGAVDSFPGSVFTAYPWLIKRFPVPQELWNRFLSSTHIEAAHCIISVYAWAVHMGDCTFEQAIAWIRANESEEQFAEPVREESCNSVPSAEAVAK